MILQKCTERVLSNEFIINHINKKLCGLGLFVYMFLQTNVLYKRTLTYTWFSEWSLPGVKFWIPKAFPWASWKPVSTGCSLLSSNAGRHEVSIPYLVDRKSPHTRLNGTKTKMARKTTDFIVAMKKCYWHQVSCLCSVMYFKKPVQKRSFHSIFYPHLYRTGILPWCSQI